MSPSMKIDRNADKMGRTTEEEFYIFLLSMSTQCSNLVIFFHFVDFLNTTHTQECPDILNCAPILIPGPIIHLGKWSKSSKK